MKNNKLLGFSNAIPILVLIYIVIQIDGLRFKLKFWISYNNSSLLEILLGIFREICEILYIPLWGIIIYFSILFCEHWIRKENKK